MDTRLMATVQRATSFHDGSAIIAFTIRKMVNGQRKIKETTLSVCMRPLVEMLESASGMSPILISVGNMAAAMRLKLVRRKKGSTVRRT